MTSAHTKASRSNRLALSTAITAALLSGYGSRQTFAGDCSGAAGTYTCSMGVMAGDTTQTLNNSTATNLTVTTSPDFGIDTTGTGNALELTVNAGGGNLRFTDNNNSAITGATRGISATNNGKGATTIETTGAVEGTMGDGIFANNTTTATNLDITTAAVTVALGVFLL